MLTYDHGITEPEKFVGRDVEIPVHYDMWMRGARLGRVVSAHKGKPGESAYVKVRLDHPQAKKLLKVWQHDFPYMRARPFL